MKQDINFFSKQLKLAARSFSQERYLNIEEFLFPFWEKAIHNMLLQRYCPCMDNKKEECFLNLSTEEKKTLLSGDMSFKHFVEYFQQGREMAILV